MKIRCCIILFLIFSFYTLFGQIQIASIIAEPDTIYADGNVTYAEITVHVVDEDSVGIADFRVDFDCDLGSILYFDNTDDQGFASTTFFDSYDVGIATITATAGEVWDQVNVTILPPVSTEDTTIPIISTKTYPNPFRINNNRDQITILFSAPFNDPIDVIIYDIRGRVVKKFSNIVPKGTENTIFWNGKNDHGISVESGIYLYKIDQKDIIANGKISIIN